MMRKAHNREQALKALVANLGPRFVRLAKLEAYVDGTQYSGLPSWFDDSVPLFQRAPSITEPIAGDAIDSFGDFLLGDGRQPYITTKPEEGEDAETIEDPLGLDEDQAEEFDRHVRRLVDASGLLAALREGLEHAMGSSSVALIGCLRNGRLEVDIQEAKCSTPTWVKGKPGVVAQLEIRYPYLHEFFNAKDRRWEVECRLFRRVITDQRDITYKPRKAAEDGSDPDGAWVEDADLTVEHGLGFCPVHWYAFGRRQLTEYDYDGKAIHANLLDEIDALNRGLSQRNRAALYSGDPQLVELGVDLEHNPAPAGETSQPMRSHTDEDPTVVAINNTWRIPSAEERPAGWGRKKGPGVVWRYPFGGADGSALPSVKMLCLEPGALESIENDVGDLRSFIASSMSYVKVDPATLKGMAGASISNISGRMLEWLYKKQTNRASKIRVDFGERCILPTLWMLMRIVALKSEGVYIPGAKALAKMVTGFKRSVEGSDVEEWFMPRLRIQWPPFFDATEEDRERISAQVREDYAAGIITLETVVRRISAVYDIDDVAGYIEKLTAEKQARQQAQMELMHAAGGLNEDDDSDPGGRGSGPGGAPESGSGGAGPPAKPGKGGSKKPAAAPSKKPGAPQPDSK